MNAPALQEVLQHHFDFAPTRLRLGEELGTHHGLAWDDFVLLEALDAAGGSLPTRALAGRLGLTASALVRVLLPLEKTGIVERAEGPGGVRCVRLRGNGLRLLREARETAQGVCAERASTGAGVRVPASP